MYWWRKPEIRLGGRIGLAVVIAVASLGLLISGQPFASAAAAESTITPKASRPDLAGESSSPSSPAAAGRWAHGQAIDLLRPLESRPTPVAATLAAVARNSQADSPTPTATAVSAGTTDAALGSAVPASVRRWSDSIVKYAGERGVDPNLVAAIMTTESQGNPNAISPVGAIGLMQVMGGTYDPDANIRQGVTILADNLRMFGGNLELSLAAYNAGPAAVQRYGGIPPYPETQTYVYRVLNRYYLYSAS